MLAARLMLGNLIAALLPLLLACAGDAQPSARPGGGASAPSPVLTLAATVQPAAPAISPTRAAVTRVLTGASPQITPDMDGQVVELPAGKSFLVNLGRGVDWLVTWTPPGAVQPVLTTVRPDGSQGYFIIGDPGRTVQLRASGARICPSPAAAAQSCIPDIVNMVTVTVVTGPPEP